MKPLLIIKINSNRKAERLAEDMKTIAEGIENGALVLGGDCEVIAFDDAGRLVYPIRPEEVTAK